MLDEYILGEGAKVADHCPHCDRDTSLEVAANHRVLPDWGLRPVGTAGIGRLPFFAAMDAFTLLRVFRCMFCGKPTLALLRWDETTDPVTASERAAAEAEIIWPRRAPRELSQDAPDGVRSLFLEASVCEGVAALRGAAAMLRACVEEIVRDKGAAGKTSRQRSTTCARRCRSSAQT